MEINTTAILGYVITILLIPMVIYTWHQSQKRGDKMEAKIDALEERLGKCEVDAQETKTNYVAKFGQLREQINKRFEESGALQNKKFDKLREAQTLIQVSIEGIRASLDKRD